MFKLIGALSLTPLQDNNIHVINLMHFRIQHDFVELSTSNVSFGFHILYGLRYVYIGVIVYQYVGMLRLSGGLHFKSVY